MRVSFLLAYAPKWMLVDISGNLIVFPIVAFASITGIILFVWAMFSR